MSICKEAYVAITLKGIHRGESKATVKFIEQTKTKAETIKNKVNKAVEIV